MQSKIILPFVLFMLSVTAYSQQRILRFSEIRIRNKNQQWETAQNVGNRVASFSSTNIDVTVDRNYHLKIVSRTDLPDNGVIYLCKDDKSNQVTVTLINNEKMFFYTPTNRYLINFSPINLQRYIANMD